MTKDICQAVEGETSQFKIPSVSRLIATEQSNVPKLDHAFKFKKQSPTHDLIQFSFPLPFLFYSEVFTEHQLYVSCCYTLGTVVQGQQALAS